MIPSRCRRRASRDLLGSSNRPSRADDRGWCLDSARAIRSRRLVGCARSRRARRAPCAPGTRGCRSRWSCSRVRSWIRCVRCTRDRVVLRRVRLTIGRGLRSRSRAASCCGRAARAARSDRSRSVGVSVPWVWSRRVDRIRLCRSRSTGRPCSDRSSRLLFLWCRRCARYPSTRSAIGWGWGNRPLG
jgi:hypothetical protein